MDKQKNSLVYKGDWSVEVRKDFILNPVYSIQAKALYIAIKTYCSREGDSSFPSSHTLARVLDISRDSVFKYAAELERMGLLSRKQDYYQKGDKRAGQFTHTVYTLYATENPNKSIKSSIQRTTQQDESIKQGFSAASEISRDGKLPLREIAVTANSGPNNSVPIIGEVKPVGSNCADAPVAKKPRVVKAHPDRTKLSDAYMAAYRRNIGEGYVFSGAADSEAADKLLKSGFSVDEIIKTAEKAWKHPDMFNCKFAITLRGLGSKWPLIRAELRNVNNGNGSNGFHRGPVYKTPQQQISDVGRGIL